MTHHINGVRDQDGKLNDMLDLKGMCDKLNTAYPKELEDYFSDTEVLDLNLPKDELKRRASEVCLESAHEGLIVEGRIPYGDGALIDLEKIPKDIKYIRVFCT